MPRYGIQLTALSYDNAEDAFDPHTWYRRYEDLSPDLAMGAQILEEEIDKGRDIGATIMRNTGMQTWVLLAALFKHQAVERRDVAFALFCLRIARELTAAESRELRTH